MIIFRTEASQQSGIHRLMRCTILASLLKYREPVSFLLNPDKIALKFLADRKYNGSLINKETFQHLSSVNCIVFDLSKFTSLDYMLNEWAADRSIPTVLVAETPHYKIETNFIIGLSTGQEFSIPPQPHIFRLPFLQIHHPKFIHFNKAKRKYQRKFKNVLICLGGSAEYRLLRQVIDMTMKSNLNVKVACGFYLKKSSNKILKRIYPALRFVGKTDSLARPLFESDLAIITPGQVAWEAVASGTPALYICQNAEQEKLAHHMQGLGFGEKLNVSSPFKIKVFADKLKCFSYNNRFKMGNKGKISSDGKGVYRIIDFFKIKGII